MVDYRAAELKLRNEKPKAKAFDLKLGGGLSARVAANGTKLIHWRGKNDLGKVVRVRLGYYPDLSIEAAARAAAVARSAVRNGVDLSARARAANVTAEGPATVKEAAARFKAEHLEAKARARWRKEATRILDKDVLPAIGGLRLKLVRRASLTALADAKAAAVRSTGGTGVGANRLVAVLSRFFAWCTDKGWLDANPAIRLPKPVKENKRKRVLTRVEMGEVWLALQKAVTNNDSMPVAYSRVLALLMITGCRASEITGLRRRNVNLDAGTFEIVEGKNDASNRVVAVGAIGKALLVDAIRELEGRARDTGKDLAPDALLFPMPRAGGVIDSTDISKAARVLVADLGHKRWTPHDLRRSLTTQASEMGAPDVVVRRITGHVGKDTHDSVYDRSTQLDGVRRALERYEEYILTVVAEMGISKESNVISLRG